MGIENPCDNCKVYDKINFIIGGAVEVEKSLVQDFTGIQSALWGLSYAKEGGGKMTDSMPYIKEVYV